MEVTVIQYYRGNKYACNDALYSRYCRRNNITYVICDYEGCEAKGKIEGNILTITNDHASHESMLNEIERLRLLACMRKRAATEDAATLRNIFDEECRQSTARSSIGFAEVESSMYKRRRVQQPSLPTMPESVDAVVQGTRYTSIENETFYRGQINAGIMIYLLLQIVLGYVQGMRCY